ncbi:MAG TPA: SDR family NAD(P)-dependent oxidoreductase [Gammaproteobacteria bacterium]|nr:SDR family NAD(P)-dependent oxidoreductase [Gammaproteobacteria bacterium]
MPEGPEITAIVGVGPGLGAALAERFAAGGHALALLSRSARSRGPVAKNIASESRVQGYDCDAGDPASVAVAFARVRDTLGNPTVLIYNAGNYAPGGILEMDPDRFEAAWRANCFGGFLAAREVLPAMLEAGAGTILFTGATAALRGAKGFAGLAVGKFGLRALAQSMAREFAPGGIHVAHVVIDGQIGSPSARERQPDRAEETFLAPGDIAETYWQLYTQPRSTWTQELDLRPDVENF